MDRKRLDIFGKGMDKNLNPTGSIQSTPIVQPTSNSGLASKSLVSKSVKSEDVMSGDMSVPLFSQKKSPQDTTSGFWMGWDKDHTFKWSLGSPFAQFDFNVTSPGVFYINLPRSGAGTNAIFINDGSNDNNSAIDVRRFNGTGAGIGVTSSAGWSYLARQNSNTPAFFAVNSALTGGQGNFESQLLKGTSGDGFFADIRGTGGGFKAQISATSGDFSNPFVAIQNKAFNTNYYKVFNANGGGAIDIQLWIANNASPNTILTGEIGDFCFSTNGHSYICQGGTAWTDLTPAASPPPFTFVTDFAASTRYAFDTAGGGAATFDDKGYTPSSTGPGRKVLTASAGDGYIYAGNPKCSFPITNPGNTGGTNKSIYVGMGDVNASTDVADYTKRHVGIKLIPTADNTFNVIGTQGDGTAESASSSICTVTNVDYLECVVDTTSDTSATYRVRLNGVAQTPATVSGHMPVSTTSVSPHERMTVGVYNND